MLIPPGTRIFALRSVEQFFQSRACRREASQKENKRRNHYARP
jgi:hypothetical protein